ncbi:MAG: hypothetical protein ACI9HK_000361 [Pirellulaceae bacterium]|jgi:hypothetical protein
MLPLSLPNQQNRMAAGAFPRQEFFTGYSIYRLVKLNASGNVRQADGVTSIKETLMKSF